MKRLACFIIAVLLCMSIFVASDNAPREFTTAIRGEVIDRPDSKVLLLSRIYEDDRIVGTEIPIVDGKFSYDLTTDTPEMYQLAFVDEQQKGSWRPVYFFAEPGEVRLTLYPMERYDENKLSGPELNTEYAILQDSINMWNAGMREVVPGLRERGYEPMYIEISYGVKTVYRPDTTTVEGQQMHEEFLAAEKKFMPGKKLEYYRNNPSIVSYALLYKDIKGWLFWGEGTELPYLDVYNSVGYAEKYPDHPYTRELANKLGAVGNIIVGGKYIDFTLPDLDGSEVTLSEYIDGKIALLDLWMTWCGPCRRAAKATIPVYEEFKDKGFTVVGVSGDGNLDQIRKAAQQDGHPWITLVDLRSAKRIWSQYGLGQSGGSTFLVDRDGTILAVNPSAEQLREILLEKL